MYRRAKFVEILLEIREEMAQEADYDVDLFAELTRSGGRPRAESSRKKLLDDRSPVTGDQSSPIRLEKDTAAK
jgi:hypothetical protein